jgi:hypothetical protein
VGIPRSLRDFQARWESRVYDFSTSRLFHSPSRAAFCVLQRHSFRTVMPQTLGAVSQTEGFVQVLVHRHDAAGQRRSPAHRLNL